ncbi:Kelch-like protein 20 [Chionoecetes opilio]|uniref:Kelch-like protein 20 n=1 Tax=Chionoecetes opilio TaxID=41210 RepID=A0A8J4XWG7_CHIOP|nr:Kelch-like protein 20 [Chionoecetes opilio]
MAQCGEGGGAGMLRRDAGCQRGTLGCEGHESQPTTPNEDCKFVNSAHPEAVLKGLNDLRKSGHFCDVTLCVDGRTFPVHRSVLDSFSPTSGLSTCSMCPGFILVDAMFLSNLAESQQEHITLSGVEAGMVALLLDYAYTSTITITEANVQALLSASNLLEVVAVREACCRFLERHIDATNCVGIHCFAEAHACDDLTRKAKAYTLR